MYKTALFLIASVSCLAQPVIYDVQNAASNIPNKSVVGGLSTNFSNGSIALGAMFVVKGSKLGPDSIVIAQSYPLQTTLGGTSVQVVVAGKTINAIMYYTQSQQVAAILPSTTPLGTGYISVTYNGRTNASAPINIVQNNIAMYTLGQTGAGDAIVTLADNTVVLSNNAPNPGDVIVFWANGLGPVTYDETMPAAAGDMVSIPLEVFVGGQPAEVVYRGRNSCCVSLDQINVRIPQGVTTGCVVSVVMRIGNLVSNTTTIPVAQSGHTCTPTNSAISQTDVQRLMSKNQLNIGIVTLERALDRSGPLSFDSFQTVFRKYSAFAPLVLNVMDFPAPGSCTVTYQFGLQSGGVLQWSDPTRALQTTTLDGGNTELTGASGIVAMSAKQFLEPGAYTIQGSGGTDVGAFQAAVAVPQPFTWSKPTAIATLDRSQGVTVTWSGADPSGLMIVSGFGQSGGVTSFSCTARASDGSFTVSAVCFAGVANIGNCDG